MANAKKALKGAEKAVVKEEKILAEVKDIHPKKPIVKQIESVKASDKVKPAEAGKIPGEDESFAGKKPKKDQS